MKSIRALFLLYLCSLEKVLAGGFLLLGFDWLWCAFHEMQALGHPHRFAAPLLLIGPVVALPVAAMGPVGKRLFANWSAASASFVILAGVCLVGACGLPVWFYHTRQYDLPLEATVLFVAPVALVLLMLALAIRRRCFPSSLLIPGLVLGCWLAAVPFRRVMPMATWLPALGLLGFVCIIKFRGQRIVAVICGLLALLGIWGYGEDMGSAARLGRWSFVSAPLVHVIQWTIDVDGDGVSPAFGGGDCDDSNPRVYPGALEIVGNQRDDNCTGGELASLTATVGDETSATSRPALDALPDILLLSLDAVRPDRATPDRMPHFNRVAQNGIHATAAYSTTPYTIGAVLGLMTSSPAIDYTERGVFVGTEPSLAQELGRAGYHTVSVQCLADLTAESVMGFQIVDNTLGPLCHRFQRTTSNEMADISLRVIGNAPKNRPLFLWAHFTDPHLPHIGGYDAEIQRVDAAVGRILAGRRRKTITVLLSDHGESFGGHGYVGHIWRLDEEMLRIVLAFEGAGVPEQRLDRPVSIIDVAPTLLDLLSLPAPAGWHGRSLLNAGQEDRPVLFESKYRGKLALRGMRVGDHKITRNLTRGLYELYNTKKDPDDRDSLVGSQPRLFEQLRKKMGQMFDRVHNDRQRLRKLTSMAGRPLQLPGQAKGPLNLGNALSLPLKAAPELEAEGQLKAHQMLRDNQERQAFAKESVRLRGLKHATAAELFQRGVKFYRSGKLEDAARAFRRSLREMPNSPDALVNLGFVMLDLKRARQATVYFERAIKLVPDSANAYYGAGLGYAAMNQKQHAGKFLRRYIALAKNGRLVDRARAILKGMANVGQ